MAEWEKEIAELKTDVKYIREDVSIINCRCYSRSYMDTNEDYGW